MKNDKKFIVSASSLAQKAVDYILEHQVSTPKAKLVPKKRKKKEESMSINF